MSSDQTDKSYARTSRTHPLLIAGLPVGQRGGAIGVTFAPGKQQQTAMTGIWQRDLITDLEAIRDWGALHLITLLEPFEFEELNITRLPEEAGALRLQWHGLPITDGEAPDSRFLVPWITLLPTLLSDLEAGRKVVVHCKGGLGRAGTVACLLLMESGSVRDADEAMEKVRAVRRGAIETCVQEQFLRAWSRGPNGITET